MHDPLLIHCFDFIIVGRMFVIGFVSGPINHAWYTFLDRAVKGTAGQQVFRKIILDQIIASPFFNWFFFMGKCFVLVLTVPIFSPAAICCPSVCYL